MNVSHVDCFLCSQTFILYFRSSTKHMFSNARIELRLGCWRKFINLEKIVICHKGLWFKTHERLNCFDDERKSEKKKTSRRSVLSCFFGDLNNFHCESSSRIFHYGWRCLGWLSEMNEKPFLARLCHLADFFFRISLVNFFHLAMYSN